MPCARVLVGLLPVLVLLAAHVTGSALSDYAGEFALSRYEDPAYLEKVAAMTSGQL